MTDILSPLDCEVIFKTRAGLFYQHSSLQAQPRVLGADKARTASVLNSLKKQSIL